MSKQYLYSGEQTMIIWSDQSHDQSSLQYFDANDTVIHESTIDESYVTTTDSNETQYLSILEHSDANEITLEDLHNLTVENGDDVSDIVLSNAIPSNIPSNAQQENNEEEDGAEVIVFTMDGSDDLYGIQVTHDETGNMQKYQFKFRTTPDGQLEPIPETVTLLPNENQIVQQETDENLEAENEQTEQAEEYFLVQTPLTPENSNEDVAENNVQVCASEAEHVYIKGESQDSEYDEETNNITDHVESEMLNCIDSDRDSNLQSHLENLCIKNEVAESVLQNIESANSEELIIKQEHFLRDENSRDVDSEFDETFQNEPVCEEEQLVNIQQQQHEDYPDDQIQVYQQSNEEDVEQMGPSEELHEGEYLAVENEQCNVELFQHFMSENDQIEVQYETELEAPERSEENSEYNEAYGAQEDHPNTVEQYFQSGAGDVDHDSEMGQYQITEDYEDEALEDQNASALTTAREVVESYREPTIQRTNILKHALANSENEDKSRKPLVSVKYYVVYPEKENVNSLADDNTVHSHLPIPKLTKTNSRSVLRNSFFKQNDKQRQKSPVNVNPECDLYHKRFAKNKDAMRAKHFHNFLNRTTIPHAPVRQQRQPRKQKIKPVIERSDEEIIVQEVIVSSNGFIESLNKKVMDKKLQITAVVELSDSEDDSSITQKRTRKKNHHVHRKPSECESIIEIYSDNEEFDILNQKETNLDSKSQNFNKKKIRNSPALKRRRGRPPKNHGATLELSPRKRNRTDLESDNIVSIISEIEKSEKVCPFCPKTFPSQNSLNTHIIHHNLENSLKNKAKMTSRQSCLPRQSLLPKVEYGHKCGDCQQTFKNTILLQKHNCPKKLTSLNCSVCLKQFRDIVMLNIHKKSHAKSNLVKNTSVLKISPKKMLHRPSMSLMKPSTVKSPKKFSAKPFKCTECPRVCDSEEKLTTHIKTHKRFLCSSCLSTFSSKLLLDTHVRTNCVKIKAANNKRLSFTIRKSFMHTPPRRVSIAKPNDKTVNSTANQSVLGVKLDCDKCNMKFTTFRNLYTHKVQKHGMSTPDKSVMAQPKQRLYKPKAAHGGIPANDRLKKAYAALRKKLAETEGLIVQ